ncbi:MAG TPA: hypothetical protein VIY86_02015, partial [Pirellulaceae bacterium]
SSFLANTSDIHLASGAVLDLNFGGGPDVVESLFINGVSQLAGIWGRIGSAAQFTSPWITGTGLPQVTTSILTGDFDHDGDFDCSDIDGLVAVIAAGTNIVSFDLTGDSLVDQYDLTAWLSQAGSANLPSGGAYIPGDGNLDGLVDGSDFGIWNSHKLTMVAAWCSGDFNADGAVDGTDFGIWNAYKFTSADGTSLVPEPCHWILLFGAMILGGPFPRRSTVRKRTQ